MAEKIEVEVIDKSNAELVSEFIGKTVSGVVDDDDGLNILFSDGSKLILNAGYTEFMDPDIFVESDLRED